jgi:hypothetical protein
VATNIAITISADMLVEGEETLGLNLSNPLWLTFATNRAFGVIVDDDFRMASPRFNVTNATLSFHSVSNRPHRVEWAPSLTPPVQWSTVPGAEMLLGHGGVLSVSDAAAGASNRFYRVLLLP